MSERVKEFEGRRRLRENWPTCEDAHIGEPGYFYLFPMYIGELHDDHQKVHYKGTCFENLDFELEYVPSKENFDSIRLHVTAANSASMFCKDYFFIGTSNLFHIDYAFFSKSHVIEFTNLTEDDKTEIQIEGLKIFQFCDGIADELGFVIKTLKLFMGGFGHNPDIPIIGGKIPAYQENANVDWINHNLHYKFERREIEDNVIDEKYIHSGDFFGAIRLDGLSPMIMYGTGAHLSHCITALWIEGELYMIESQGGDYWPVQAIQRTPYRTWVQYAKNADMNIVWLPLKDEYREKFDEKAALEWFEGIETLPYGYHNFMWGWIDTPYDNFPDVLPSTLVAPVFGIFERLQPEFTSKILLEPLNFRLNTKDLNLKEIVAEANRRGMTIEEVFAIPEEDDWQYSDGVSLVCSSFVVRAWKAGGLFEDLEINAVEQGPKDVYQMDMFNTNPDLPASCKLADPELNYC